MQKLLDQLDVQDGKNFEKLIEDDEKPNPEKLFKKQQTIINYAMHACDVSAQTRSFGLAEHWTALLFDEFFT